MNTPYKNSTNLQGNSSNLNNVTSAALYPSMQSGFIPFEESTPKNKNKYQQNSRNNTPYSSTPYNPPYFSANRQNNRGGGGNWSQNRNKNFKQNYRNNLQFSASKTTVNNDDNNSKDYKDNEGNFNRPQFQHASGGVGKNRYNNFHQNNRKDNFFNNRRGGGNNRFGNNGGQNKHQENTDISEYVHPSMLEDPWKDLIERDNALNSGNLKIFDKDYDQEESNHESSSSSESDKNSNLNDDEINQDLILDDD